MRGHSRRPRTNPSVPHTFTTSSLRPGRVLFGPAVPISCLPSCSVMVGPETRTFGALFQQAVGVKSDDARGKVLVLASNGHRDVSLGGGTKLSQLARYGLAGVLTDAWLRDCAQLQSRPFAAYCSAEAVRRGGDVITPYQANVPIVVAGWACTRGRASLPTTLVGW
ncbi:hypothetical protein [Streptomyces sp. NPDC057253]|uniref:RraA family protein n=1 Tax=Streptomyces sp. NPDC057253 TaxID=3346069 RepID=UPI0036335F9B